MGPKPNGLKIIENTTGLLKEVLTTEEALDIAVLLTSTYSRTAIKGALEKHRINQLQYAKPRRKPKNSKPSVSIPRFRFLKKWDHEQLLLQKYYETPEMTERTVRTSILVLLVEDVLRDAGWFYEVPDRDPSILYISPDCDSMHELEEERIRDYDNDPWWESEAGKNFITIIENNAMHPSINWGPLSGENLWWGVSLLKLGIELEGLIGDDPKGYVEKILKAEIPEFFKGK